MRADSNRRNRSLRFWKQPQFYPPAPNSAPGPTAGRCICIHNLKFAASARKPRNNPMAVSLPTSAVAKAPSPGPAVGFPAFGVGAPSTLLPLTFMLIGLVALCAGVGALVARPDILSTYHYNQYVIAVTHLFALGWLCSIVMGAMYQLVPVALETKLYSERLAKWQFVFHVVGFTGMVWMFWTWNLKQVGHFGSVMAVGVGLFVYNLARTLRRVPKWNVTAAAITAAVGWITFTILVGLAIAAAKCSYESETGLAAAAGVRSLLEI